jgi:hypothetical protein
MNKTVIRIERETKREENAAYSLLLYAASL